MRPLITGIIIFLAWLVISSWYYSRYTWPTLQAEEETTETGVAADTAVAPPDAVPVIPDPPGDITLYFDFDKTVILNPADLDAFIPAGREYLSADTTACLQLTGHACNIGTEAYNLDLGKRRARSVNDYLLKNGFTTECVKAVSKGESQPAVPNTSEANRKKNRRVEITFNR